MLKKGCRICEFFRKYPYKVNEKELFEKKCREGVSLRNLELLLEAYGCQAKKDLINRHIHECMGIEKGIQKEVKSVGKKLRNLFTKPEIPQTSECKHLRTRYSFDHNYSSRTSDGLVWIVCLECGEVISKFDPEEEERRMKKDNSKNLVLYRSLARK